MAETLTAPANAIKEEADFIAELSGKLERGEVGVDRGRAKQERVAADEGKAGKKEEAAKPAESAKGKPAASAKSGTAAEGTTSEEGTPGKPKAEPETEDPEKVTTTETGESPAEEPTTKEEPDKDSKGGEDDKKDDDVKDLDDDIEDTPEAELAREAQTALEKYGLKMTMDDVPKEARPLVEKKLAHMTAAFTRAMMEQREYRKEEGPLKAERDFIKKNLDLFIYEQLQADPSLADKINARVEEGGTETGKEALKVVTGNKRKEAFDAIQSAFNTQEQVLRRADEITTYVKQACLNLNLPFDTVVEAVVNRLHDKPDSDRNLTQQEMDAVIGKQQRIFAQRDGDRRREQKKSEIKGRAEDRKTVSPAAKASGGAGTIAPANKKAPKTDDEFVAHMEQKRGGK